MAFEKITDQQGSEPHIEGTEITVSEIVKQVLQGKSVDDLLALYPGLSCDAVVQALGFSVKDMVDAVAVFAHDGLAATVGFRSASYLLQEERFTASQKQYDNFVEIVRGSSARLRRLLFHLREVFQLTYEELPFSLTATSLSKVLDAVADYLFIGMVDAELNFEKTDQLPVVRADRSLEKAIINLATLPDFRLQLCSQLNIGDGEDGLVTLSVYRAYGSTYKGQVEYVKHTIASGTAFERYGMLSVARSLIRRHGSELRITPDENGITFEFDLAIADEPTS